MIPVAFIKGCVYVYVCECVCMFAMTALCLHCFHFALSHDPPSIS